MGSAMKRCQRQGNFALVALLALADIAICSPRAATRLTTTAVAFLPINSRSVNARRQPTIGQQELIPRLPRVESLHSHDDGDNNNNNDPETPRSRLRRRVRALTKTLRLPMTAVPMPGAVVAVLKDATLNAVDFAVDEVLARRGRIVPPHHHYSSSAGDNDEEHASKIRGGDNNNNNYDLRQTDMTALIDEAFAPLEEQLSLVQASLETAKMAMTLAKQEARDAMELVQAVAIAQAQGAQAAVAAAQDKVNAQVLADVLSDHRDSGFNVTDLSFDDVDYEASEMAPPFLDEDQCLVPGEPIVRVEKAPDNARRIFAGIDIFASVDDVWQLLTDYENLQNVVPNLMVNDVMERYNAGGSETASTEERQILSTTNNLSPNDSVQRCKELASRMRGALLRQVGGAKVAGLRFSARTTLEVREWPQGLPADVNNHLQDSIYQGQSRDERIADATKIALERYKFPRPFALSSLPTKDISMMSIENDNGEFRLYQGVWRMQPLPGCAPPGMQAMRLTYAVEVAPRAYLPVSLVEGRIVRDLCTNLVAIRDFIGQPVPAAASS